MYQVYKIKASLVFIFIITYCFLTIEHILRGPEGYADYALSYPLNNRLIEDDDSDDTFVKYRDNDGLIIIDAGANKLTNMLFESIKDRNRILIDKYGISENNFVLSDSENIIFRIEFLKIFLSNI